MTRLDVLRKADDLGLGDLSGLSFTQIARLTQAREGFEPCFGRRCDCRERQKCCFAANCTIMKVHTFEVVDGWDTV